MAAPSVEDAIYDPMHVRQNMIAVNYCRTAGSVLGGSCSGVLGLTGLNGFGFYLVLSALLSVLIRQRCGVSIETYFRDPQMVWTDGIVGGLFTYILFWTLVYAVVHIY